MQQTQQITNYNSSFMTEPFFPVTNDGDFTISINLVVAHCSSLSGCRYISYINHIDLGIYQNQELMRLKKR